MNKIHREANRAQWEEHVRAWGKSGLRQSAYCREHGLLPKPFSLWVGRVKKASAEPAASLKMVPVVVAHFDEPAQLNFPVILHHPGGWQLQLPRDVPAVRVGHVLKELT
jgi:transposase